MTLAAEGEVKVACALDEAWALFLRFEEVAGLIPTVERIEQRGEEIWAIVGTQLGILRITSRLMLRVVEMEAPRRITAEGWSYLGETLHDQVNRRGVDGVPRDAKGRLVVQLDLESAGDAVVVRYRAEVEALGRLRRIYGSILDNKAPALMREFAERLRARLELPLLVGVEIPGVEIPAVENPGVEIRA